MTKGVQIDLYSTLFTHNGSNVLDIGIRFVQAAKSFLPSWKWDMSYPAFTDMFGLVDRGDIVLSGALIALTLQTLDPETRANFDQEEACKSRMVQLLVYMHCWLHGSVEDRKKVIAWMKTQCTELIPMENHDLSIFALCTIAFGIAASHRVLGGVSEIKLDLIVSNIMAVALQLDENNLEKFIKVPKSLSEVQLYLRKRMNFTHAELSVCLTNILSQKTFSTLMLTTCTAISNQALRLVACDIAEELTFFKQSVRVTSMQMVQVFMANFHEQLCPKFLTFGGVIDAITRSDKDIAEMVHRTRKEIFGEGSQKQQSMLDSFIPSNMTRKDCGLGSKTLFESAKDQIVCANLRGLLDGPYKVGLPQHLAVIMDGNRRFAREKNFEHVVHGYTLGARQLMQIFPWAFSAGVKNLTVWAMSSDNFNRDPIEVRGLIDMMTLFFEDFLLLDASVALMQVRIRVTGNQSILPDRLKKAIAAVENATARNKEFNFQIAINYGGR